MTEDPEVVFPVTEAMVSAGEAALEQYSESYPDSMLVEAIYRAMRALEEPMEGGGSIRSAVQKGE